MDYKTLAIRIASAEDPYGEFAKEAASLDDIHKTTLAREVNKQFFLSRLDNLEGNGSIEFDVIEPEIIGTHQTRNVSDPTVVKTASAHKRTNNFEKRAMVDASMFVVFPHKTIKASSYGDNTGMLKKTAEYIINEEFDKQAEEEKRLFENNKNRAITILNDMFGAEVEAITKTANDASELRTVMGMVIEAGMENILPEMLAITNNAESTLLKVASVDLDKERTETVRASIDRLKQISETKSMIKAASSQEDLEKIALLPTAVGLLASGALKAGKGVLKGGRLFGKGIWGFTGLVNGGVGALSGGIKGATRGLFSKNPLRVVPGALKGGVQGWRNFRSPTSRATALLVGGGTALQVGPTIDKYQNITLRK